MKFIRVKHSKGQSVVEFVLIAPLLFLIFFGIIQIAYISFVALGVQRAALAVARTASLSRPNNSAGFKTQAAVSLLPISNLNRQTLLTIMASDCKVSPTNNDRQITATVRYPMPIWVPLARNLFGQTLIPSENYNTTPEGQAIKDIFILLNKQPPDLSFEGVHLPVYWVTFKATTFNEAYGH